jgi:hypothetical protein
MCNGIVFYQRIVKQYKRFHVMEYYPMSDIIDLAELELTNAIVHPDRYSISMRKKFLTDLKTYSDYNELLADYIKLRDEHKSVYPNDSEYLNQMYFFIIRLQKHLDRK